TLTYNADNNLMDGSYSMMLLGRNGPDSFAGLVIKDFYLGEGSGGGRGTEPPADDPYGSDIVYDWGLQSLHKANYPVEKYWQRSKSRRSNTFWGRTVFQKDRLVGFTPCRIVITTDGYNNSDWFEQYGEADIYRVTPAAGTAELDSVQNINP
ncbi:MAG: hypothetical protein KDE62_17440, partial [Calditrichaeota bacterium]|nr:hypothetical protein [Calditrichota bacterium]